MYGYYEYLPLTLENVLDRVTQEEIFSIVIKEKIITDKGAYYKAPYRDDSIAGCWFEMYENTLQFIDFADTPPIRPKNCIETLKRTFNVPFMEVLQIINSHFSLGLGDNIGKLKEKIKQNDCVEEKTVKTFKERFITYLPREFNYKDKLFWQQYKISKQNLIDDKVMAVEIYRFISRFDNTITIRPLDLCYAYTDFPNNKVKIYRPKGTKETKWLTNCNQDNVGCLDQLPSEGDLLIISKSYKDCRVLRNLGFNCIWLQNEGMFPNQKILKDLCKRFKKIIVWFDNDSTGITNSRILVSILNEIKAGKASVLFLPPKLLEVGIKDPSDLLSKRSEEDLISFLKSKNLLDN